MKKKTLTEALVLEDFQRAIVFLTLLKIKKSFKNASEYAHSKHTDKAKYLHIDSKTLKRLSTFDNRRLFSKFLDKSAHLFEFHKHVAWRYASGKQFKINSWFELKFSIDELDKCLESKLYMDLKSDLYSKRIHKILDSLFYSRQKEGSMTKAEEKEIYDKAANGELGCSPEYVIKQIKKKERSQKRRQETIAKKAVQASFEEFAKLKAENEQLKAEIARLKQLKDLNSDIDDMPEEDAPSEEELLEKQAEELAAQVQIPEDDIPEELPEPAPVQPPSDDIPEEEPPHPSKVYSRLTEFVKKCYIGPSTAARLSEMYGERQEFKQPVVHCDLVAALQSNAKQRLTVLSTAFKELNGKLLKKDLAWLVSSIKKTQNEIKVN